MTIYRASNARDVTTKHDDHATQIIVDNHFKFQLTWVHIVKNTISRHRGENEVLRVTAIRCHARLPGEVSRDVLLFIPEKNLNGLRK